MSMQNVLRYALANNSTLALAISQYRKVNDELLALSKSARKKPRRKEKAFLQLSLQELTDISILFMQADLEIHFSHDRLRVHSQLAKMDENLLLVGSCKKGLSVWASGVRTLDVSPSNGYPCSKFNNVSTTFCKRAFFLATPNRRNAIPCIVQIAAVGYAASQMTRM
ncbi:hypothetical protein T03_8530 [Trichinella britovi]|uniref:Uncharacterized protein n=1 Tax=Trichinella britovi TaxID=45882 RepID=A0A0V1C3L8_TRIBR|nr:hypothetical protein T03_8530 [Trichinella britovi]